MLLILHHVYTIWKWPKKEGILAGTKHQGVGGAAPPLFLAATIILDLNMKNIIIMELAPNFLGSM